MPEKTSCLMSSIINDEKMDTETQEKKIPNLTKVGHMCMVCGFRATTKNKYRELQDHLVRQHFQDRIKSSLPTRRPFMCPDEGCKVEGKDWQALMRHYTGKHGILEGYLKEVIASGQVAREYRDNMKKPRISALNPILEGYDETRNKENNGRQNSIQFSRGTKNRKRRKLRQPSCSGSTGSNSSISGASGGSSGSDEFHANHNNDQEMPMSSIGATMGLAEGNNNIIENGKVSHLGGVTLSNQNFPSDVTQQLLQLQHPLPPVRWKQNANGHLPEVIEVDETDVAEKPTHLALVLKQKNSDQGFEIGRSDNDPSINNGLQYDEMYAFVDLKCFMPVSPNEYVIVPPKPTEPTASPELLHTGTTQTNKQSLTEDIDNFVAVPMPSNHLTNPSLQSNQNISHSHQHLSQLSSFQPQIATTSINPSFVSNSNGTLIYQNTPNPIGHCNGLSQEQGIYIGSDITSAPGTESLSSLMTDVTTTDSPGSLATTYYTNQAGEILTAATLANPNEVFSGEDVLSGQTFIIPSTNTSAGPIAFSNSLSSAGIPENFNISTTSLQPQFAPISRQIITRPYNPQGIIVPVSSNARPGPILISAPPQSHIGLNGDYKHSIHNEMVRSESYSHNTQLSHLPSLVTIPSKNVGSQQIDLGQIVRQTITAPTSSVVLETGDQIITTQVELSPSTTSLVTGGQESISMGTDLPNQQQAYNIPLSTYPTTCASMSTASVEAAEAAVAAANSLNGLTTTTSSHIYCQSNTMELQPASVAFSTINNQVSTSLTKSNFEPMMTAEQSSVALQLTSANSMSSDLPVIYSSPRGEISNAPNGIQHTPNSLISTPLEPPTSLSSSKSLDTTNAESSILLQNRPMIMEVKEVSQSITDDADKTIYKCVSGNEDNENDSGIENDCLSTVGNRVIVEEAKSIPIDDRSMTIVQIEGVDEAIDSNDVDVATTVTVETATENEDNKSQGGLFLQNGEHDCNTTSSQPNVPPKDNPRNPELSLSAK